MNHLLPVGNVKLGKAPSKLHHLNHTRIDAGLISLISIPMKPPYTIITLIFCQFSVLFSNSSHDILWFYHINQRFINLFPLLASRYWSSLWCSYEKSYAAIGATLTTKRLKCVWSFWDARQYPFKCQPHKMVKHTQTICRLLADELFECVWPFCGVGA